MHPQGKRGDLNLRVLLEIMLLVAVVALFFYYHRNVQEDTLLTKSYVVRDVALLLETVQSVPGDVELYYSQPLFDIGAYHYKVNNNLFQIYEKEASVYGIYYPFFLNTNLLQTFETTSFEEPAAFVLSKRNKELEVKEHGTIAWTQEEEEEKKKEETVLSCPAVASTKTKKLRLVVIVEDPEESALAKVQTYLLENPKIDFAKKESGELELVSATDLVLVLAKQTERGTAVSVTVPADEQSEKLGCLLANSILSSFSDATLSLETSDVRVLTTNLDGLAIRLEIGEEFLENSSLLNNAIKEGLEEYYP